MTPRGNLKKSGVKDPIWFQVDSSIIRRPSSNLKHANKIAINGR
jgi:hypothetical protein